MPTQAINNAVSDYYSIPAQTLAPVEEAPPEPEASEPPPPPPPPPPEQTEPPSGSSMESSLPGSRQWEA